MSTNKGMDRLFFQIRRIFWGYRLKTNYKNQTIKTYYSIKKDDVGRISAICPCGSLCALFEKGVRDRI